MMRVIGAGQMRHQNVRPRFQHKGGRSLPFCRFHAKPVHARVDLDTAGTATGGPLSKREGATSLADLREQGYLPAAMRNFRARLGHSYTEPGWMDDAGLAAGFSGAGATAGTAAFTAAFTTGGTRGGRGDGGGAGVGRGRRTRAGELATQLRKQVLQHTN
jgi:hypothetical protein